MSATNSDLLPPTINTGVPELDAVWERFAGNLLAPGIPIPDTEEDLNWHAFLGHSIDMQGFRAAEFAGVDALTKAAPEFQPLMERGIGVTQLAGLWEVPTIRDHLLVGSRGTPLPTTLDALRDHGAETGASLAEAFEAFPYGKGHWTVRALLQNSALLAEHGHSFRRWLAASCAKLEAPDFPPPDFRVTVQGRRGPTTLEVALRDRIEQTFYRVGPALAAYMICDWQLWLWKEGLTGAFATFKLDSFHEQFVARHGRGLIPTDEPGFAEWWLSMYPSLPPRLANECIWLGVEHGIV